MILRKATFSEQPAIWEILQQAIQQRKQDGSDQWQNGYPNEQTVGDDIQEGHAYVLVDDKVIVAYAAIIFGIEPAYNNINGKWITNDDYVVVHRVATANAAKGKGIATLLFKKIELLSISRGVYSIKVDTNFDNVPMLKILDKLNYVFCGEVFFHGAMRRAYEKVLTDVTETSPAGDGIVPDKVDVLDNGPFYHGTRADLAVGDLLTSGFRSNYKPEVIMNHIYFTALVNGAGLAAALADGDGKERVYIVEPTGSFENDPNVTDKKFPGNPTRSYRSQAPLKIVGEITDWVRLTPEELRDWRERIAKLRADSKAEIIN